MSKSIRNTDFDLRELNGRQYTSQMLENLSVYQSNPAALFYQTGYLTIKRYDPVTGLYTLGYPNREVERGILGNMLQYYVPGTDDTSVRIKR